MNKFSFFQALCLSIFLCASCIKSEAPNMEADITTVLIADSLLTMNPIINNRNVVLYIRPGKVQVDSFALTFQLTAGATISPNKGEVQDFRSPVIYTVSSQDRQFQKRYVVSMVESSLPSVFDFEHVEFDAESKYVTFYELVSGLRQDAWASGNAAFSFIAGADPAAYPTQVSQAASHVVNGQHALLLETKSSGFFGSLLKMPIAAGNLFIGSFDGSNLQSPLTKFGLPYNQVPQSFIGYYNYKPGAQVTNREGEPLEIVDECAIYAVWYDRASLLIETGKNYLDERDVLSSPYILGIAKLDKMDATAGDAMQRFEIPFAFKKGYNEEQVLGFGYNLAIVMSSSKDGADFQGAVGSRLIVDYLKIETK